MKNFSLLDLVSLLAFGMLAILPATSGAQQRPPIAEQIAKTYGLDSFGQVEAIRYTFNADFPGTVANQPASSRIKLTQKWEWKPKTDTVSYEGKDKDGKLTKVTYQRSQSNSPSVWTDVDPWFVNDQYWLLFPLHVAWDGGATVTDKGMQKTPLGKTSAELVVVQYPKQGGYTPGDTWELYVGTDNRVKEFIYLRVGPKKPNVVIATWTGYKKAGPLFFQPITAGQRTESLSGFTFRMWRSS
jgi:hypothetical protein